MKFGYENLEVTGLTRTIIKEIYKVTQKFPKQEIYGLISQIRRAAVSVLLNIAEGNSRNSKKDHLHFITISVGSLVEMDCALKISVDLKYIEQDEYGCLEPKIKELYFKLIGLEKYLRK